MTTKDKLQAFAANMWWSWNPEATDLFRTLNPPAFQASENTPHVALTEADPAVLNDAAFAERVDTVYATFEQYMSAPTRFADAPKTSYFCMEYGLHESMPIYSGGLGVLAGDHAKAASDLGVPFTAVGLLLRKGYFKQSFNHEGWQQASYPGLQLQHHPLRLVREANGSPVVVTVELGRQPLYLIAWQINLGRTTMYLLDSDFGANPAELRPLTTQLYGGDRQMRIRQEIVLGIGGMRLLRALDVETEVYHLNEGHCAFLIFELLRERLQAGDPLHQAEDWVRRHCVFTTHTPVMAGHDRFTPELFIEQMAGIRMQLGLSDYQLLSYGRVNPNDVTESFTMTVLGLKLARKANGVSKLNGEVARHQWHHLYPNRPVHEVPIGHITNGVHLPSWTSPIARDFYTQHLGDWDQRFSDAGYWTGVDDISDEELWGFRSKLRKALVDYVHAQVQRQGLPQTANLDPDALTIGFARRFATYKRAPLLFHDLARAIDVFSQEGRPVQVLYAGKAHPADHGGQAFIKQIYDMTNHPAFKGKLVFLENYNMEIGRMLTSGCDIWLNNPRRPYEASGTSGQKVAAHGGLNLSILDGWWPEGYNGNNGWAIGHDASSTYKDPSVQDPEDAGYLYDALLNSVIPDFYERDANGIPTKWVAHMREAMRELPVAFSASRMVSDYVEQMYRG